jgi:hypothetical protein
MRERKKKSDRNQKCREYEKKEKKNKNSTFDCLQKTLLKKAAL